MGRDAVEAKGGRLELLPIKHGLSTTTLLQTISSVISMVSVAELSIVAWGVGDKATLPNSEAS
jgi:hypothetical protein